METRQMKRVDLSDSLHRIAERVLSQRLCERVDSDGYAVESDPIEIGRNVIQALSEFLGWDSLDTAISWARDPDNEPAYMPGEGYIPENWI